jgi:hypothetical protein
LASMRGHRPFCTTSCRCGARFSTPRESRAATYKKHGPRRG